ncbi:hypothetical protein LTR97_000821 [Elasticomyces elasticus]|uniref:F-box domain-containing protein n=1 Tax=Elasticomyces elasticus TaxID=574655 RepID=A0AAN7WDS9_9PEZI|nr:hypothetical protein LTR97_000821 [Elasticomyces elasticus]
MATHQVFHFTELLEIILLDLPMQDLLLAQRVCSTWKGVIDGSQAIQRALFFIPGSTTDITYGSIDWKYSQQRLKCKPGFALNPLFVAKNLSKERDATTTTEHLRKVKGGSCARMFDTQPPSATSLRFFARKKGRKYYSPYTVRIESGEKFGFLVEQYFKKSGSFEGSGYDRGTFDLELLR